MSFFDILLSSYSILFKCYPTHLILYLVDIKHIIMKFNYLIISISIFSFSCSNPAEERNSKMTDFINREKIIQFRMDSLDKEMSSSSFIDTFILEQVTPEVEAKRRIEDERKKELGNKIVQLKSELKSLKFSMDSLSKMK